MMRHQRASGYAAIPAVTGMALLMTLSLAMLFQQNLMTRDQAAKTQLRLDYHQREDSLMRALVALLPAKAAACMKSNHVAANDYSWATIFREAVEMAAVSQRLAPDLASELGVDRMRDADVGNTEGALVQSWITSLSGQAGRMTPGTTEYADVFNQPAFAGRVPPLLDMDAELQQADAERPVVSPKKRYTIQSAGLLADVGAYPLYNLIPYPNVRFGYAAPGQPFVAKRNWWAFSVNYGGPSQPMIRHYVLSLYEVPTQMPIEAAALAEIGRHQDGAAWNASSVRIQGAVYAEAMSVQGAFGAERLAGRTGIELEGALDVGGVTLDENFDALGVREMLQASQRSDALPVALSANSGRLAFLPIQPGRAFLQRPPSVSSEWQTYVAGGARCRVSVEAIAMVSLADQTPTALRVRFQRAGGGASEVVLQRGVNWPTVFEPGGGTMPFQTELMDNSRSCLTFHPTELEAWLTAQGGDAAAVNNSLYFGVDASADPLTIGAVEDPPAADDMCLIIRKGRDLSSYSKGLSVVTPLRVYVGDDLNDVPLSGPPVGSGLEGTEAFYPPLSIFAAELRIGTTSVNRLVEHRGQIGTLTKGLGARWSPLDIKLGSDDAVHSENISADLRPLRSPAELPPVHQMNWLVVIEEIPQD
jgi:hypothetical protein